MLLHFLNFVEIVFPFKIFEYLSKFAKDFQDGELGIRGLGGANGIIKFLNGCK